MARRVPSLVDLCVRTAIDNARNLGDVGDTDFQFLERILPHCTLQQLMRVEHSTKGRDISPVTDGLWKKFFERQLGTKNFDLVVERMEKAKVKFAWRQVFEAKAKDLEDKEKRLSARMRERYKVEEAKKQNHQIQMCDKIPPSAGRKRIFYGEPDSCVSRTESSIMKKAKLEFANCIEVKNLAAMKMKLVQRRTHGAGEKF